MDIFLKDSSESLGLTGDARITTTLTCSQEAQTLAPSDDDISTSLVYGVAINQFKRMPGLSITLRQSGPPTTSLFTQEKEEPPRKILKTISSGGLRRNDSLSIDSIRQGAAFFNSNTFNNLNKTPLSTKTTIGSFEENSKKNRYPDVLPNDSTMITTSKGGYFNGNLVNFFDNTPEAPTYIATQAPLINTVNNFWDVVFESETDTIVMLTNFIEQRRKKADIYWPDASEPEAKFLDVTVKFLDLRDNEESRFTVREFEITRDGRSRIIKHFHFLGWPDRGVAEVRKFNALLEDVENCHKNGPLVVHCSAGIGRAGTFIATHKARDQIRKNADEINIFEIVNNLREHRAQSVQNKEQFQLIYDSLVEFITQSNQK